MGSTKSQPRRFISQIAWLVLLLRGPWGLAADLDLAHVIDSHLHTGPQPLLFFPPDTPGINTEIAARTTQHQRIEEALYIGEIIDAEKIDRPGHNEAWSAKVRQPNTGVLFDALIKPRRWGDGNGWNNVARDYTAYFVNLRILGMDYVPPTAYRKRFILHDATTGKSSEIEEASIILKIPEPRSLVEVPEHEWRIPRNALLSDHRILRYLLGDPDGHEDNVIFGTHWNSRTNAKTPIFVDFGASFISTEELEKTDYIKAPLSMTYYSDNAGIFRHPIQQIRRQTWNRLQLIQTKRRDEGDRAIFAELGDSDLFLNPAEQTVLLDRIDAILRYFEPLERKSAHTILDQ
jgi:hypothetical protein